MLTTSELLARDCTPQAEALSALQAADLVSAVPAWHIDGARILRNFDFRNYHATLAFIDAIAPMIHAQDHHPELVVTYNRCVVKFDTHSVNGGQGGLSVNDFICAAKVDAIFESIHTSPGLPDLSAGQAPG